MKAATSAGLLGLFPAFAGVGGIERSGRLAWEGIVNYLSQGEEFGDAYLFCYSGNMRRSEQQWAKDKGRSAEDESSVPQNSRFAVFASSKPRAVLKALRRRWPVGLVLVWHVGLMKLLPFLGAFQARIVLFLHGIEAWRPQGWLTRTLLSRVDLFLSNSEYTWQRFSSLNPSFAGKLHQTVHLGIGSPVDAPTASPAHSPAVLMVGRLMRGEDYKGHRELIRAWPLVLRRIPDAELWIAGDGDLRPELEKVATDLGIGNRVRFFGRVTESEKENLLTKCRCLAMPSRGEGFGLVYLEAMRLGRPCLVSTLDAGREVVNPPEAGLAADPDNPEALAGAIVRLLTPGPEWDQWARQAQARYEAHFTARHFQERLIRALFG